MLWVIIILFGKNDDMKRIYISILFLVLAFIGASVELGYVNAKTDFFISLIEQADEYIEKEKYNDAFTLCNEMEEKWKDSSKTIDMMLNHEPIDSVGVNFAKMSSYIKNGRFDLYYSESISAKKELAYIKESESLNTENIL